jgi:hypothetical protein
VAVVSIVLLFFSGLFVTVGLIPCLGWINWTAIPLAALTAMVGLVGLFSDRDPDTLRMRGVAAHLAALVLGSLLTLIGIVRCAIGLGTL